MNPGLEVCTPHGGWWGSCLVQGRGGASLGLRSQSLGRATRPGGAGLWRAGRLLGGKQRLPRLDPQRRDPHGIDTGRPDLASSAPGKPQKRNIQFCPPSDTFRGQLGYGLPHLAEGGLARGGGPVGAHFCPPVPVESSPVGSCLRVSDFRLYCYFLKKKILFKRFPSMSEKVAATCI